MKKIMFNDRYGLTEAVLDGSKMQTRRIMKGKPLFPSDEIESAGVSDEIESAGVLGDEVQIIANGGESLITMKQPFRVGEVVAVAQSYCSIIAEELENSNNATCAAHYEKNLQKACEYISWMEHPGFNNKMFVAADMMIHQIRITDVGIERLQDISDEDCIKEGVRKVVNENGIYVQYYVGKGDNACSFENPREAFAHLINKVSRKDVWKENPYVFVYDFELVK